MITPRRTTLTSVPGLRALHQAIADACASPDEAAVRATVVLVPTRAAALALRRTLEDLWLGPRQEDSAVRAIILPDLLTRAEWYGRMERWADLRDRLSEIEREVLAAAAARDAVESGLVPPFRMRPGLVSEMLALYDGFRRRQKTVADFERLVVEDLEPRAEFDRGAERLLRQTRFLAAAFRAYEARLQATGTADEHLVRHRLLEMAGPPAYRRVIVTVGDHASDPAAGLYPADFDLMTRLPGIESIDVLATRASLAGGLGERLRDVLPGIEEIPAGEVFPPPILVCPPEAAGLRYFLARDREAELRDIARRVKRDLRAGARRVGVVFRRPLPYVYLGRTVFESAGIEFQTADALPLAAEPYAAAIDLALTAVTRRFGREAILQLLRSPQFAFSADGREPGAGDLAALDRELAEAGYLGDLDRLREVAATLTGPAAAGARAAIGVAEELAPLSDEAPASAHLARLQAFMRAHERHEADGSHAADRHARARVAVLRILNELSGAALAYDDPPVTVRDLAPWVRRWLESQTFTPARGEAGVRLADAQSARYGDFDQVHLAGLVSGDWPESSTRNIFYPPFLLSQLGWPPEPARLEAERAAFADLLRLGRDRVLVSSFALEDDSIVEPSPLLDEIERSGLPAVEEAKGAELRIFADEALSGAAIDREALSEDVAAWAELRAARPASSDPRFRGFTGEGREAQAPVYSVTGIDRYLECPFKYFASTVLKLPEEAEDEQEMSPRRRGRFVHEILRAFYAEWQSRGGAAVTPDSIRGGARAVRGGRGTRPGEPAARGGAARADAPPRLRRGAGHR